jgi:SAM-dependent methyltransferase
MNKYKVSFFIVALGVAFCGIRGMENEKKVSMIERKAAECALSKLVFADDEKIVHVGFHCEKIIQTKALDLQVYCINADILSMMQEPVSKYDKVLTFGCWDVVENPKESFKNSARLLRSQGQFCAVIPHYKSPYLNIHYQTLMSDKWKEYCNKDSIAGLYRSKTMKKFLVKAGLGVNAKSEIIKKPFLFKTKEKFMEWIASYPVQLNGIPQERQEEFINDIVASYLEKYPATENGLIKLYLPYMILSGYKS